MEAIFPHQKKNCKYWSYQMSDIIYNREVYIHSIEVKILIQDIRDQSEDLGTSLTASPHP